MLEWSDRLNCVRCWLVFKDSLEQLNKSGQNCLNLGYCAKRLYFAQIGKQTLEKSVLYTRFRLHIINYTKCSQAGPDLFRQPVLISFHQAQNEALQPSGKF
jgi:hypothetical protein